MSDDTWTEDRAEMIDNRAWEGQGIVAPSGAPDLWSNITADIDDIRIETTNVMGWEPYSRIMSGTAEGRRFYYLVAP